MAILSIAFVAKASAQSFTSNDIIGLWFNEEKDAKIEIFQEGNTYNGKIVWLDEEIDPDTGKAKTDKNNPEPELRSRPTLGLQILNDFEYDEDGLWEDGSIYDPKSGKTYKCKITMEEPNTLYVRGYIGKSWMGLGRTTEFSRVEPR